MYAFEKVLIMRVSSELVSRVAALRAYDRCSTQTGQDFRHATEKAFSYPIF
jgi:hypothetical protein